MSRSTSEVKELQSYFFGTGLDVQVETGVSTRMYYLVHATRSGKIHSIRLGDLGHPGHLKPMHAHSLSTDSQDLIGKTVRILMRIGRRPGDHGIDGARMAQFVAAQNVRGVISLIPVGKELTRSRLQIHSKEDLDKVGELIAKWPLARAVVLALCNPNLGSRVYSVRLSDQVAELLEKLAKEKGLSVGQYLNQLAEYDAGHQKKAAAKLRTQEQNSLQGGSDA